MGFAKLEIANEKAPNATELVSLDCNVEVSGLTAETVMTMIFKSNISRNVEAELVFALPEGATVCGFALDVNGRMVEGVVVTKEKARVAFEAEVRKGHAGPGIAEVVAGSFFKTRVYPVPANGQRIIRVAYTSSLVRTPAGISYILPLALESPLPQFKIDVGVNVVDGAGMPTLDSDDLAGAFAGADRSTRYVMTITKENVKAKKIAVNIPNAPVTEVLVERDTRPQYLEEFPANGVREPADQVYFSIDDEVQEPTSAVPAATGGKIGILWDASRSQLKSNKQAYVQILEGVLAAQGNVTVALYVFRNVVEPAIEFPINGGNAEQLLDFLSRVDYDGGTDLTTLPITEDVGVRHFMVFTDGLSTFETSTMPKTARVPLYLFNNDANANHTTLRTLARISGGEYFNLNKGITTDAVVARMGSSSKFSLMSVDYNSRQIAEVFPSSATPVNEGHFVAAGRLAPGVESARITFNFGSGGQVLEQRSYDIHAGAAYPGRLASLQFAQRKLDFLLTDAELYEKEILALGRRFSLVTPNTSLIVLETLSQYQEHKIEPPASLGDIRDQYLSSARSQKSSEESRISSKMNSVYALWETRLGWWNRDFVPKCCQCNGKIKDGPRNAWGKEFHQDCFKCGKCNTSITNEGKARFENNVITCYACRVAALPPCQTCQKKFTEATYYETTGQGSSTQCTPCYQEAERKRREEEAKLAAARAAEEAKLAEQRKAERDSAPKSKMMSADMPYPSSAPMAPMAYGAPAPAPSMYPGAPMPMADSYGPSLSMASMASYGAMPSSAAYESIQMAPSAEISLSMDDMVVSRSAMARDEDMDMAAECAAPPPMMEEERESAPRMDDMRERRREEAPMRMRRSSGGASAESPAPPPPATRAAAPSSSAGAAAAPSRAPPAEAAASITIKAWDPSTPYLNEMKGVPEAERYKLYLKLAQQDWGNSPAFYLDCASYFYGIGLRALGLRVLSNVVELKVEEAGLVRIVGYKCETENEIGPAISMFEKVLRMRPEEPQSYRDLATVIALRETPEDYARAIEYLVKVLEGNWDSRFAEIEVTALTELNRLVHRVQTFGMADKVPVRLEKRFLQNTDVDVRIVMAWDTDMTDIDLHVIEPRKEEVYYSNKLSKMGGMISKDFTRGYGPEEYLCKDAETGSYLIRAKYFSNSRQDLSGATTVLVKVYSHFGRPNKEQCQKLALRLAENKDIVDIGAVTFTKDNI